MNDLNQIEAKEYKKNPPLSIVETTEVVSGDRIDASKNATIAG